MTILVAYKPSETAKAALSTALDVARQTGEHVVVVNAGPGGEHRSPSLVTEAQQQEVQRLLDDSGVSAEFRQYARGRSTADELKSVADELDPSIVVVGLRRRGGFGRFVMGSVSDELLQVIDQPVLAVKEYRGRTPDAVSSVAETDPATHGMPSAEPGHAPRPFTGEHAADDGR
ncbi:universal stress protein [Micrococcus porci]|uniref:universal stress protein n=1 Tax=Micrococcus TaxID=1269 RepID=UPI001CCA2BD2|nr:MULTISPECIES: universal stress protein [Micrococcus]MCG7422148.1 universal stress protein [Micrococcus sp. ACRRV]UBH25440.1 universal stress protein [Micrococcus porci]